MNGEDWQLADRQGSWIWGLPFRRRASGTPKNGGRIGGAGNHAADPALVLIGKEVEAVRSSPPSTDVGW